MGIKASISDYRQICQWDLITYAWTNVNYILAKPQMKLGRGMINAVTKYK